MKKLKKWGMYLVGGGAFFLISFAGGLLLGRVASEHTGPGLPGILAFFAALLLACWVQIILHEGGHMVFGLLTGYRFSSFRIGSFMWVKEEGKLRLKRLSIAGTGGQCIMAPPPGTAADMPVFWYHMGGVAMNLITALLFWLLFLILPEVPFLSVFLMFSAVIGVLYAILNGIPIHSQMVDNDGQNAKNLLRSQAARESMWMQLAVSEQTARGVRLRDMRPEWFTVPADEEMKDSLTAARGVFAANRLMDAHRFAEADALMEHLLTIDSGMAGLHRSLLLCDRMYVELLGACREEKLDVLCNAEVKNFMRKMKKFPTVRRVRYAEALLRDQDPDKAEKIRSAFEKESKRYPYASDIQSERELMELARQKAEIDKSSSDGYNTGTP